MRLLALSVVVLIVAIFLGLEIIKDPGMVLIQIRGWSIETSVAIMGAALIVAFAALYVLFRLAGQAMKAPRQVRNRQRRQRENRARRALNNGLIELTQGHWKQAEKALAKAMAFPETAELGYLGAARAAHEQGNSDRRDRYLKQIHHDQTDPDVATGITEAQLAIENQELEKAASSLRQLHRRDPKNPLILRMLKDCYLESHSWYELVHLVPTLEKCGVISKDEGLRLERHGFAQLLNAAAQEGEDSRALDAAWQRLPHGLRRDKELLALYIRYLMELGEGRRPESILREKLKAQWDNDLVYLYGLLDSGAPAKQLATAEKWLKRHPEDATLLLTLGRLALRNHLWGKARSYLEQSIDIDPRPETYMLLGKLLEQSGEQVIAGECFRKGLGITVNGSQLPGRKLIESEGDLPALTSSPSGLAATAAESPAGT